MKKLISLLLILPFLNACSQHSTTHPVTPEKMSMEAMYEVMAEASTPGKEHEVFDALAGTWNAASVWQMSAGAPAEKSSATSVKTKILNDLFLQETYEDSNPEHPFTGLGLLGYDKVAKQYTSSWYDTMSSGNYTGIGTKSDSIIAFSGGGSCPMTGGFKTVESELEIISKDKHIYRMFDVDENGESFMPIEIVYTRVK